MYTCIVNRLLLATKAALEVQKEEFENLKLLVSIKSEQLTRTFEVLVYFRGFPSVCRRQTSNLQAPTQLYVFVFKFPCDHQDDQHDEQGGHLSVQLNTGSP